MIRLQKYLAQCGVSSRRNAEKLISQGKVRVNKIVVSTLGTQVDPDKDEVIVAGKVLKQEVPKLYLFYKPKNVITTLSDPQKRKSVKDFLTQFDQRIYPVGRLDYNVQGLLLLTNDGEFANSLLHPTYQVERKYLAYVSGIITESSLRLLTKGIQLDDGFAKAKKAKVLSLVEVKKFKHFEFPRDNKGSLVELIVTEGRKHFVKRILYSVGHPVIELCRVSYGQYQLGNMHPGMIKQVKSFKPA